MRKIGLFIGALVSLSAGATNASQQDARREYDIARRCYVANGEVYSAFKRNGDVANAQLFENKSKNVFGLVYFYGDILHLDREQIAADLKAAANAELPKLMQDSGYLTSTAKDCKSRGMM